jgi:hypothetical protein|mmetsp:Transcript_90766/g.143444  ORF Transcript_90766/g.143444 Transcript_90766/m.143444 type:complete len:197 (+) Transcript_90766:92-682(+)
MSEDACDKHAQENDCEICSCSRTPSSGSSLGIIAVRMASEAIEVIDGITYFAIDVFPDDITPSWRVLRRYNDFIILCLKLGTYHLPGAPFPRKHLTGCAGAKLERRRENLENWLSQAVLLLSKKKLNAAHLRAFLEYPSARSASLKQSLEKFELPTHTKLPAFIVASTMSFHSVKSLPEDPLLDDLPKRQRVSFFL